MVVIYICAYVLAQDVCSTENENCLTADDYMELKKTKGFKQPIFSNSN